MCSEKAGDSVAATKEYQEFLAIVAWKQGLNDQTEVDIVSFVRVIPLLGTWQAPVILGPRLARTFFHTVRRKDKRCPNR